MDTTDTAASLGFLCGLCEAIELPGPFITEVFQALGMSPSGTRSYLMRAIERGEVSPRRQGRVSLYRLCGDYARRYETIQQHWFTPPTWKGHFQIVLYDLPESQRAQRDALRAAAFAEGWGCPRPGVLIGVRAPGPWATGAITGTLQVEDTQARRLVASSWPMTQVGEQIRASATQIAGLEPRPGGDPLAHVVKAHDVFSTTVLIWGSLPQVPERLFPADFPHQELAQIAAALDGSLMNCAGQAAMQALSRHRVGPDS